MERKKRPVPDSEINRFQASLLKIWGLLLSDGVDLKGSHIRPKPLWGETLGSLDAKLIFIPHLKLDPTWLNQGHFNPSYLFPEPEQQGAIMAYWLRLNDQQSINIGILNQQLADTHHLSPGNFMALKKKPADENLEPTRKGLDRLFTARGNLDFSFKLNLKAHKPANLARQIATVGFSDPWYQKLAQGSRFDIYPDLPSGNVVAWSGHYDHRRLIPVNEALALDPVNAWLKYIWQNIYWQAGGHKILD